MRSIAAIGTEALDELVDTVLWTSTHRFSALHGEHHWQCVAAAGAGLAAELPAADPLVVFLFALFHDAMRANDEDDPGHGRRGGLLARELLGDRLLVDDARLHLLEEACSRHTDGVVSLDPTLGACWDADRLNLWRVGIRPDPRFLSTPAAREPERIEAAKLLQHRSFEWPELYP